MQSRDSFVQSLSGLQPADKFVRRMLKEILVILFVVVFGSHSAAIDDESIYDSDYDSGTIE